MSKSRGARGVLSRAFAEKEAAMDERRKRERVGARGAHAEADAKLRLARETLESARKERESARKEWGELGGGVPGASREVMPPPPPRSAMPTPRQLPSTRSLRPPGLFGRARGPGAQQGDLTLTLTLTPTRTIPGPRGMRRG